MMGRRVARAAPVLLLVIIAVVVSACGFRPRGHLELPADFREVYVQGSDPIRDELEFFLTGGGANLTENRDDADAVIKVSSESFNRRVSAVDPFTGKEREFEIVYVVEFSVRLKDKTMLVAPQSIKMRRSYIFDETAAIGSNREERIIREEMRRDAALSIVRRTEAALGK